VGTNAVLVRKIDKSKIYKIKGSLEQRELTPKAAEGLFF
jgi:hypothetical protein